MSGFEVVAQQLRAAADQIGSAADGVRFHEPSRSVARVGSALRGGQSAAAAASLQNAWSDRFHAWHDDAVAQRRNLIASADSYDASDYQADARLQVLARRTGEQLW